MFDGQLMAFAWMAVKGRQGDVSEARSATLPLPPAVKDLVDAGMELELAVPPREHARQGLHATGGAQARAERGSTTPTSAAMRSISESPRTSCGTRAEAPAVTC